MSDFFKWFAGIIAFSYVIFIAIGQGVNGGMGSIANACKPVQWVGSLVGSASEAVGIGGESPKIWTNKADYTCQYSLWGVVYGSKYEEEQKALKTLQAPAVLSDLPPIAPAQLGPQGTIVQSPMPAGPPLVLPPKQ